MKRTDRMTDLVGLLLFAAALLYLGAFGLRKTVNGIRTARVTEAEISFAVSAGGIIVRSETLLQSDGATPAFTVRAGERAAAGSALGGGLTAPVSGVFSPAADGYESVSPADLAELTPTRLRALLEAEKQPPANAVGKLVTDHRWYFAALTGAADAAELTVGKSVTLDLGAGAPPDIPAEVFAVSGAEGAQAAVVFCCETHLADTLQLRRAEARVVTGSVSGLSVPAKALQTDADGNTYVWTVTAAVLERKDVTVLRADGDTVLVSAPAGSDRLRAGNAVVVRGKNLYEGKVIE